MPAKFGAFTDGKQCKRGHLRCAENIRWTSVYRNGKVYKSPRCKVCSALDKKLRYHSDPAYREHRKASYRNYYYRVLYPRADNAV